MLLFSANPFFYHLTDEEQFIDSEIGISTVHPFKNISNENCAVSYGESKFFRKFPKQGE